MIKKLISSPAAAGIDLEEMHANPGAVREIHEDVLRDLMRSPAAIERPQLTERVNSEHPRRRTCV